MEMRLGSLSAQGLETKSAAVFGIIALVISFILGLVAGNGLGFVLMRSLILSLIFAGIGFGAIVVLRKFVPEFIEVLESSASASREESEDVDVGESVPTSSESAPSTAVGEESSGEKQFQPLGKDDFMRVGVDSGIGEGKLGRHFVDEKKTVKYEPKIIADAIRTMIRRDE
jgi:hypothetical protein